MDDLVQSVVDLLEKAPLFIDTETTGLDEFAQAIEIAVCEKNGDVVFYTRLQPSIDIPIEATQIHGITNDALKNEPQWPSVVDQLISAVNGRPLVAYNAPFDDRILKQTARAFGMDCSIEVNVCAMSLAAQFNKRENGRISLSSACKRFQLEWDGGNMHSAIADAKMTAKVVVAISASGGDQSI